MTLLLSVTILFGMSGTTVSAAAGAVADDTTVNHWHDSIAQDDTTKNIGRIWTDKSVSAGNIVMGKLDNSGTKTVEKNGDSDFLVGLSALSSAAKIMGQSTVPLDIVMVLDVSGSMDDNDNNNNKKIDTLKTAVNAFIDESAKANSERSNENLRSRISLVRLLYLQLHSGCKQLQSVHQRQQVGAEEQGQCAETGRCHRSGLRHGSGQEAGEPKQERRGR